VCYTPDESQVVTCGSDKKIASWDVFDGTLIRELEGSVVGTISGLDMSSDGRMFATGGQDQLIKVRLHVILLRSFLGLPKARNQEIIILFISLINAVILQDVVLEINRIARSYALWL
jgi:hypothetical protein